METLRDQKDFEQTAIPQMDYLHGYALHLTRNRETAKDLMQDTYLKAYRFWNSYEQGTNIKAWLIQIMKNSYINLYRKKVREPRTIEYDEYQFPHDVNQIEPLDFKKISVDTSYDEIFEDEVAQSLKSLSHDFRTILLLCDIEDFTYEEIANIINCPIGTVRSRLHRGRKQLQNELFNYARANGYILKGCQA
jgi:RNA polymerase sigma-70 factor, ECF subfamily